MMKRTFALTIGLALAAQSVSGQGLEFSGGANFSKLNSADIQNAVQTSGLTFGMDLVLPLGPLGLNLGADWSQEGVRQEIGEAVSLIDLAYVEVPVHLRVPIVGAGPIRLHLVAGPTLGINTGCEITEDLAAAQACADLAEGGFEPEKLEWAGVGGFGVSFGLGSVVYTGVDLKYTMGLSNVSAGSSLDAKNRTFTLTSHVGFGIF